MSKVFRYEKIGRKVNLKDRYEEYGDEFGYKVEDNELLEEVVNVVFDDYFDDGSGVRYNVDIRKLIEKGIKNFVKDFGFLDDIVDAYEDCLKEIFREEAFDNYD